MIVVRLNGGLGNQMFQYGFAKMLCSARADILRIDLSEFDTYELRKYELDHYKIKSEIATKEEIREVLGYNYDGILFRLLKKAGFNKYINNYYIESDPSGSNKCKSYLDGSIKSIYVEGYFQDYRHFTLIYDQLKNEYLIKSDKSEYAQKIAGDIHNTKNTIAIHIRRGDYVANSVTLKVHGVCSSSYYKEALTILRNEFSNVSCFVFSDDIASAKSILSNLPDSFTYVDGKLLTSAHEDLYLMSLCEHNIIANSSFSWWAAYLNDNPLKKVVFPTPWFDDQELMDRFPMISFPKWIGVNK